MKYILFVVQLIPALFDLIKAIEKNFPGSGLGAEKLRMVREMLENAFSDINEMWPTIEKVIGIIVTYCNKLGWGDDTVAPVAKPPEA